MNSYVALIAATSLLVLIPGPNVALIVANSFRYGLRLGVVTVLGTTLGVALQLSLVVAGLTAIVEFAADALVWIRWAGVAYLVYLGISTWRKPVSDLSVVEASQTLFWRGCLLAVINPKTLLFNAAFLPQFVTDGSAAQFSAAAAVFLVVIMLGDIGWAVFATRARILLGRYATWRNRLTGAFLVIAGIGLGLCRRS